MKPIAIIICLLCGTFLSAQPSNEEVKKHKIQKVVEKRVGEDTIENTWWYDSKGYDSLQQYYGTVKAIKNTFKNGKLSEKTINKADGINDVYVYEYKPDGSYKETFTDGSFKMKSYTWYDKKGKILKSQSPDGNTTTYKYDLKGKLLTVTSDGKNDGIKINHKYYYNAKGQLIKLEWNVDRNKTVTTYEYDPKGVLIKESESGTWEGESSSSTSTLAYNEKGLIKKKTTTSSSGSSTVIEYEYEYYK